MTSGSLFELQDENLSPIEILRLAADRFHGQLVLATALGPEAQVLTHMIARSELEIPIFTIDTGRLFEETQELIMRTNRTYGIRIEMVMPDLQDVEEMVGTHGPNMFREDRELRKQCCFLRKVVPLQRVLSPYSAWMTGMRRNQSVTRESVKVFDWDEKNLLYKVNPLVNWTSKQVWDFIRENDVPYNDLHDQGFPSIGCAPCTRAIQPGEEERAGRWWWESPQDRECGIHIVDGRVVRRRELVQA